MDALGVFGLLLAVITGACCLRLDRLETPTAVVKGESAWLNCSFDLERDELYSVKWYKNNVEFYRFLPTDTPRGQKYELPGVYVDLARSEYGSVFLNRTDLQTEGLYRCEVSAEAPSFQTVREEKELRVYVLPSDGPSISGVRAQYQVGDDVNVTCSAGPSKPAASLKWHINGLEAPTEFEIRYGPILHQDRLKVSKLGLFFRAEPRHFYHGAMKLRCTAVISQAYSMSSEEIIVGSHAKPSAMSGDGPVITGGKPKYQKGDTVDVNCTSGKSNPAAELKWYINDKAVKPEYVVRHRPTRHPDGQWTSVLGLRFQVHGQHFARDEMRLKCTATLSKVINMQTEQTLLGSSQQASSQHISEKTGAVINRGSVIGIMLQTLFACTFLAAVL